MASPSLPRILPSALRLASPRASTFPAARPWPRLPLPPPIPPTPARRAYASFPKHPKGYTPPTSADLTELRERVQDFTRRHIPEEVAARTDRENEFPAAMWKTMGEAGLLGPTADEGYGGLALGYQAHLVIMEELSRASGSIALSYAAHSQLCVNQLCLNGSAAQKEAFLPALIAGEKVGALAMSEVGAGSDVLSMKTTAERVAGGYVLNGSKMWITNVGGRPCKTADTCGVGERRPSDVRLDGG